MSDAQASFVSPETGLLEIDVLNINPIRLRGAAALNIAKFHVGGMGGCASDGNQFEPCPPTIYRLRVQHFPSPLLQRFVCCRV